MTVTATEQQVRLSLEDRETFNYLDLIFPPMIFINFASILLSPSDVPTHSENKIISLAISFYLHI